MILNENNFVGIDNRNSKQKQKKTKKNTLEVSQQELQNIINKRLKDAQNEREKYFKDENKNDIKIEETDIKLNLDKVSNLLQRFKKKEHLFNHNLKREKIDDRVDKKKILELIKEIDSKKNKKKNKLNKQSFLNIKTKDFKIEDDFEEEEDKKEPNKMVEIEHNEECVKEEKEKTKNKQLYENLLQKKSMVNTKEAFGKIRKSYLQPKHLEEKQKKKGNKDDLDKSFIEGYNEEKNKIDNKDQKKWHLKIKQSFFNIQKKEEIDNKKDVEKDINEDVKKAKEITRNNINKFFNKTKTLFFLNDNNLKQRKMQKDLKIERDIEKDVKEDLNKGFIEEHDKEGVKERNKKTINIINKDFEIPKISEKYKQGGILQSIKPSLLKLSFLRKKQKYVDNKEEQNFQLKEDKKHDKNKEQEQQIETNKSKEKFHLYKTNKLMLKNFNEFLQEKNINDVDKHKEIPICYNNNEDKLLKKNESKIFFNKIKDNKNIIEDDLIEGNEYFVENENISNNLKKRESFLQIPKKQEKDKKDANQENKENKLDNFLIGETKKNNTKTAYEQLKNQNNKEIQEEEEEDIKEEKNNNKKIKIKGLSLRSSLVDYVDNIKTKYKDRMVADNFIKKPEKKENKNHNKQILSRRNSRIDLNNNKLQLKSIDKVSKKEEKNDKKNTKLMPLIKGIDIKKGNIDGFTQEKYVNNIKQDELKKITKDVVMSDSVNAMFDFLSNKKKIKMDQEKEKKEIKRVEQKAELNNPALYKVSDSVIASEKIANKEIKIKQEQEKKFYLQNDDIKILENKNDINIKGSFEINNDEDEEKLKEDVKKKEGDSESQNNQNKKKVNIVGSKDIDKLDKNLNNFLKRSFNAMKEELEARKHEDLKKSITKPIESNKNEVLQKYRLVVSKVQQSLIKDNPYNNEIVVESNQSIKDSKNESISKDNSNKSQGIFPSVNTTLIKQGNYEMKEENIVNNYIENIDINKNQSIATI